MIYSNEAEQAVIGSLVLDINCQNSQDAAAVLKVDDFSPAHQPIYQTIKALMAASKEVDMITVSEAANPNIELTMRLDEQPLMAYLANLAESSVNLELVGAYVQIIKDCSKKRALINASQNLHESLNENIKSVGELRDDLLSQIEALDDDSQQNSFEMKEVFKMFLQDVDKRQKLKDGELLGLSTGFKALDEHLLGLEAGNLTVIGARPSMGKTAVSLSIARHQAIDNEKKVVYLNFEMNKVQLGRRLVSQIARVDQRKLKQPNLLEPSELTGLKAAGQLLAKNDRLIVVDCHGSNMHQIKALLKKLNKKYDFDIVICDYLQKISHDHNNQVKELGAICSMFRDLGELCGFHTMMLAQLNRALEQRPNKRPVMSDLRASGEIEQDADDILMLYRDEVYNEDSESKGVLEVIPVKAREGETGKPILLSSHLLRQGLITDLEPSYQNNY